jgi:hypothetical protein
MRMLLDMFRDEPNAAVGTLMAAAAAAAVLLRDVWRDESRIAQVRRDRTSS